MYYTVGRCIMKKGNPKALPTMIGVAEDASNARGLSIAMNYGASNVFNDPGSLEIGLTMHNKPRHFRMNDYVSVGNVITEISGEFNNA